MTLTREQEMLRAFAQLADTLVADYDVVDLLQNLVDLSSRFLGATASGVMLADEHGELDVIASTSEASRLVWATARSPMGLETHGIASWL